MTLSIEILYLVTDITTCCVNHSPLNKICESIFYWSLDSTHSSEASSSCVYSPLYDIMMVSKQEPGSFVQQKEIGVGSDEAPTKTSHPQIRGTKFHMQTSTESPLQVNVANTFTHHGGQAGRRELRSLRTLHKCRSQLTRRTRQDLRPG
jgi:hypothetical protein